MIILRKQCKPVEYVSWENVDIGWGWTWEEVDRIISLWNKKVKVEAIAEELDRPFVDVWMLIANLVWSNLIKPASKTFCLPYQQRPKEIIGLGREMFDDEGCWGAKKD